MPRSSVGLTDALLLARNLATTLRAGVSLSKALTLFAEEAPSRRMRTLLSYLRTSVEQGHSLADAMHDAPQMFPPIVIHLVRTGESSGTLEESLREIVGHLRRSQDLQRKIRSAMLYPTFVLIAVMGLGLSIGIFVLPKLIPLFQTLDIELPWTTTVLLRCALFFEEFGVRFAIAVMLGGAFLAFAVRAEAVKPIWHRLLLHIPYVAAVIRTAMLSEFSRVLSTLLRSGIPIREALPATADAIENRPYRSGILDTMPAIQTGHRLAEALRSQPSLFPSILTTLVDIGEETGTLSETLSELADHFDTEVDYSLRTLTTALEPILLIGVGIIVGAVVLAIITPIYEVTGSIR